MARLIVLVVIVVSGVSAAAEIRIWATAGDQPYGLDNPNLVFQPSQAITSDDYWEQNYSNNFDCYYYHVQSFPTYSPATPAIDAGEFVYIWLQFGPGETQNAYLHQLELGIRNPDGAFADVETCYYKVDHLSHYFLPPGGSGRRWMGLSTEANNYASFRQNPQLLVAGTPANHLAWGLTNDGPAAAKPHNLYYAGGPMDGVANRIYLLGAARPTGGAGLYQMEITTFANEYQLIVDGVSRSPASVVLGGFNYDDGNAPEPAGLGLFGLLAVLARRR